MNELLRNDDMIKFYAVMFGFIQVIRYYTCIKSTLKYMCWFITLPIIYYFLASIIIGITPYILKPLLILILVGLIIYYVFFKQACIYDMMEFEINNSIDDKQLQIETGTVNFIGTNTKIPITNINIL